MMKTKIHIKQIYEKPLLTDGYRIFVERLWPKDIDKEIAKVDFWEKRIAPSATLTRWFSKDQLLWMDFRIKYLGELRRNKFIPGIIELIKVKQVVTLVYAVKSTGYPHVIILKPFLEKLCN